MYDEGRKAARRWFDPTQLDLIDYWTDWMLGMDPSEHNRGYVAEARDMWHEHRGITADN